MVGGIGFGTGGKVAGQTLRYHCGMELAVGQTVLLKHTRERARVVQELEDGQWLIEASMDRERFPVHEDDVEPVLGTSARPTAPVTEDVTPTDIRLYPGGEGAEVQVAFLPVGELDYTGALLNFSDETLVYGARLLTNKGQQWHRHGLLPPTSGLQLGHLYRDLLNESAAVEVQCSRKAELGTDSKQEKTVKLKPKLFHKNTRQVNWYPEEVAVFDVFAKARIVRDAKPSLKAYTLANAPDPAPKPRKGRPVDGYGVQAAAEFSPELDLHIDRLVENASDMQAREILELQLAHVRSYLDVAIRLGIDRVYLIHGKGSGTLRDRIHELLSRMGDLEGFRNEYHPKYGHGATEVLLR